MTHSKRSFQSVRFLRLQMILPAWFALHALAMAQSPAQRRSTEWTVMSGVATYLPGGARSGSFWTAQLRWGRVLTGPHGPGALHGTLEYAFEIVPAMILSQSGTLFGGGFNPLVLQYNFTAKRRFVPFIQLGGGLLFATREFPAGTSSFNSTPQGGIGAYWVRSERTAMVFGVRYHHTSNAGITNPNPGHNALYIYGGLSWWR